MATITARFAGVCRKCGGPFRAGATVEWSRAAGTAHVTCPLKLTEEVGSITWSEEWRFRPESDGLVGQLRRAPKSAGPDAGGKVVVVTNQRSRYVREDGLSFGLSDDSGYLVTLWARLATPEEQAKLEGEEAAEKAERDRMHAEQEAEKARVAAAAAVGQAELDALKEGLVCGGDTFAWTAVDGELARGARWSSGWWDEEVSTGVLKTGDRVVCRSSYGHDDSRFEFYSTPAGVKFVFESYEAERRAAGSPITTEEEARAWLREYDGCVGSAYKRWVAGRNGGEVPTKAPRS